MSDGTGSRGHHRPSLPGAGHFEAIETTEHDPAVLAEAAERAAFALVRGARDQADDELVGRVVHLADTEGLETLADLWSGAAPTSLAGVLWRLYLLRTWVYADPATAAREFDRGRALAPVAEAISGVEEPPGPDEVRVLVDSVLSGVVVGDFADTLFRASAFARVAAAGRAQEESVSGSSYSSDLSAARLLTLAEQLQQAARLELAGDLG
ncbi:hypothetical protein ABIE44_003531 [Marmoricola sp. OAE513]|uniref:hypothetical protein n=1 Tax=Marmoricola sp. OAE513 TaxID=2817894 RepID=UPI001AE1ED2E